MSYALLTKFNHYIKHYQKPSYLQVSIFLRQLATLITAGIPIIQACEILRQSHDDIQFQSMIMHIKNDIEAGTPFSLSLKKFPEYFDDLSCHLINLGLHSGTLPMMLNRIALHKEKVFNLRNKIKEALFYPSIISFIASLVILIMLTFVIPKFAVIFQSTHGELPYLTRIVIYISHLVRHYFSYGIILIIAILLFKDSLQKNLFLRHYYGNVQLQLPIFGALLKKYFLLNFIRSFATCISAGLPITTSFQLIGPTCGNSSFHKAITALQTSVMNGYSLHSALEKEAIFPKLLVQMIKIGEESGSLEKIFQKIIEIYENQIDHIVSNLSHLLEPLIMVLLGVLIGGLVIAMYLPIFKLGTQL